MKKILSVLITAALISFVCFACSAPAQSSSESEDYNSALAAYFSVDGSDIQAVIDGYNSFLADHGIAGSFADTNYALSAQVAESLFAPGEFDNFKEAVSMRANMLYESAASVSAGQSGSASSSDTSAG